MTKETIDNLKNRLIKLSQQLASSRSNEMEVFIDERSDFITGQIVYLGGVNA